MYVCADEEGEDGEWEDTEEEEIVGDCDGEMEIEQADDVAQVSVREIMS